MMRRKIKRQFVATLRSGSYLQGRSVLRNVYDDCCCLGVLCDIIDPAGWDSFEDKGGWNGVDYQGYWLHRESNPGFPSPALLKKAGLSIDSASTLAEMNDAGKSFSEIADWIEKNL